MKKISKKELSRRMFKDICIESFDKSSKPYKKINETQKIMYIDYSLCDLSNSQIRDIAIACFEKECFLYDYDSLEYNKTKVLYGIKSTGENYSMFYNKEAAPYYAFGIKDKDKWRLQFVAYSIDDFSYGFILGLNSKEDYEKAFNQLKDYLSNYHELMSIPDFEAYWLFDYSEDQITFNFN